MGIAVCLLLAVVYVAAEVMDFDKWFNRHLDRWFTYLRVGNRFYTVFLPGVAGVSVCYVLLMFLLNWLTGTL